MKKVRITHVVVVVGLLVCLLGFKDAYAQGQGHTVLRADLDGFHQIPPVYTEATGTFRGQINQDGTISYTLTYTGLEGPGTVEFADIHFGSEHNTGAILVFLCANQATAPSMANPVFGPETGMDIQGVTRTGNTTFFNGPISVPRYNQGLPACPTTSGTVTGTITAEDIVDTGDPTKRAGQGIRAGQLEKALEAIRSGQTYVQVHTTTYVGGELRRQIDVNQAP